MTEPESDGPGNWKEDPGVVLMLQVQAGDEQAFEQLVLLYQGPAFAMLRRILGPRESVEDLAQEAFLRVWRSRDRFRPDGKFTTFLYRVIYNLALNRIRDSSRKPLHALPTDPAGNPLDPSAEPQEPLLPPLDREVWADRIGWALLALPENQRAALVFQHYDGLELTEIGSILGISPPAVKSLLHRGRERLRQILAPHWNSEK